MKVTKESMLRHFSDELQAGTSAYSLEPEYLFQPGMSVGNR
jgi:hypothetical protein